MILIDWALAGLYQARDWQVLEKITLRASLAAVASFVLALVFGCADSEQPGSTIGDDPSNPGGKADVYG